MLQFHRNGMTLLVLGLMFAYTVLAIEVGEADPVDGEETREKRSLVEHDGLRQARASANGLALSNDPEDYKQASEGGARFPARVRRHMCMPNCKGSVLI